MLQNDFQSNPGSKNINFTFTNSFDKQWYQNENEIEKQWNWKESEIEKKKELDKGFAWIANYITETFRLNNKSDWKKNQSE